MIIYVIKRKGVLSLDKGTLLKRAILEEYRSVRAFAMDIQIPYSTLATALERGIDGMSYGTIIRICEKLNLNPIDFTKLDETDSVSGQILENQVMKYYLKLNQTGREKVIENMQDYQEISRYCI